VSPACPQLLWLYLWKQVLQAVHGGLECQSQYYWPVYLSALLLERWLILPNYLVITCSPCMIYYSENSFSIHNQFNPVMGAKREQKIRELHQHILQRWPSWSWPTVCKTKQLLLHSLKKASQCWRAAGSAPTRRCLYGELKSLAWQAHLSSLSRLYLFIYLFIYLLQKYKWLWLTIF